MTSFISTLQRGTDRLAKIIGHMIIRLVLIMATAVVVVTVGSTMGMDGYASDPVPTPAPVAAPVVDAAAPAPVVDHSGMAPHERPTAVPTAAPSGEAPSGRTVLVGLRSDETTAALWNDLLALDWHGSRGDGTDDVIYAPVGLVIFDDFGTWTITADGPARCEHGSAERCSGDEWIR